jgi:hypothetical protein
MSGRTAFAGRTDARTAEQTAEGLAAEREPFLLDQFLVEVMIVEAGIATACELEDAVSRAFGQSARARSATAGVCQSRCAALPVACFETFDLPRR